MGKAQREKGKRGEREVAAIARNHGFDGTHRGQQYRGGGDSPDVIGIPGIHPEVKRVERLDLHAALAQSAGDAAEGEIPVVIHRAIFGSFERFIGIITEHFKGAFPFWLNPYQVGIVPIRTEHNAYAEEVAQALRLAGIRFEADLSAANMKEKIKKFKTMKDPYVVVVGDKEAEERTVSVNIRGTNAQLHGVPLETFAAMCRKMNEERTLGLYTEIPEDL